MQVKIETTTKKLHVAELTTAQIERALCDLLGAPILGTKVKFNFSQGTLYGVEVTWESTSDEAVTETVETYTHREVAK